MSINLQTVSATTTAILADLSARLSFVHSAAGGISRTLTARLSERASILDFIPVAEHAAIAAGTTTYDCTQAVKAALLAARTIYLPAGTYRSDFGSVTDTPSAILTIPDGTHFEGAGEATVWKPYTITARGCIGTESGAAGAWSEGIRFSNIKFLGSIAANGHYEQAHLLFLSGVKRVLIEKCFFEGPRGDGIYIGSGFGGVERHNYDVTIRDCVFDGILYGATGGRNGVSVIDVDGMVIEGCTFRNWSRDDMPGSIDFEPNDTYHLTKNIRISANTFSACGGNRGHITFAVDNAPSANFCNIAVIGNTFDGSTVVCIYTDATVPSVFPTAHQNIVISNNVATNVAYLLEKVTGPIYGLTLANNIVDAGTLLGRIGFGNGTHNYTSKDVLITGNQITGNSGALASAISLFFTDNLDNLVIKGNIFRGATQAHISIGISGSTSDRVSITENIFIGTPTRAVQHDAGVGQLTNSFRNNRKPTTVSHNFRAADSDDCGQIVDAYTAATLPSALPFGESVAYLSSGGPGSGIGIIKTYRHSAVAETLTYQLFVPRYDATYLNDTYLRKAIDASTWAAWFNVVGV